MRSVGGHLGGRHVRGRGAATVPAEPLALDQRGDALLQPGRSLIGLRLRQVALRHLLSEVGPGLLDQRRDERLSGDALLSATSASGCPARSAIRSSSSVTPSAVAAASRVGPPKPPGPPRCPPSVPARVTAPVRERLVQRGGDAVGLLLRQGRTKAVVQPRFDGRDALWRERIAVYSLDPFRGYATALSTSLPHAVRVLDAFQVVRLGSAAVDTSGAAASRRPLAGGGNAMTRSTAPAGCCAATSPRCPSGSEPGWRTL